MNALTHQEAGSLGEPDLLHVLASSLYPGAALDSIRLVIGYCRAAGLDPMQKPVHIAPLWDAKAGRMRDVVMPGVNLYRTQAARSGQYAGMSEPEFGPEVTQSLGGVAITFPQWCRVTVRRALAGGLVAEFTAREYWLKNYAVKGGKDKSTAPNAMWCKRPRGQLAKCASAQALRIAFPEIASQVTAEEMEGRALQPDADGAIDPAPSIQSPPAALLAQARAAAAEGVEAYRTFWRSAGASSRKLLAAHHHDLKQTAVDAESALPAHAAPEASEAPEGDFGSETEATQWGET